MFAGIPGTKYSFYSIARDAVGNIEGPKTRFEATTTVLNDTVAPSVTVSASTDSLWPANGRLVAVAFVGTLSDTGSGVDVSSAWFRVVDEYGEIQPTGLVQPRPDGTFAFTVLLGASRRGNDRDGRLYSVYVTAKDNAGNGATAVAAVRVPHDQGR